MFVCCLSSECKDEKDEKEGKKERGDRKKKKQNVSQSAAHRDTADWPVCDLEKAEFFVDQSSPFRRPSLALNNSKNMLTYKKIEHIK